MKYYAVKKGRKTGIFTDWPTCKKAIDKYPNAVYKSFSSQAEAENFLSDQGSQPVKVDSNDQVLAYVDGSFMTANNRYGFGGILLY
ncbi:ribonuclease H family protein, partial [Streptococcus mitis]|nr:ribonuclease H family protein [Streptococcus mitis]